jgi:hypothetical protein
MRERGLILEMDVPLNEAAELSRALVMAISGADDAGFSEERAALEELARPAFIGCNGGVRLKSWLCFA